MPPEQRLTSRAVLSHRWLAQFAAPPAASINGLVGAVVDPACRQLSKLMEKEYGLAQKVP